MRPELERNGVEDSVLPAVRTPPRRRAQSGSSQPVSEACLEEAHREAGFSKPFTVSPLWVLSIHLHVLGVKNVFS